MNDLQNKMISIGIPFFNAEKYLSYSIISVLNQSYSNWELILIDDGSTDNSLDIANKYANIDKRVRVISDGKNKKLPSRLNQLISESKGEYVARMDADDIMHPNRIEQQLSFLIENKDYDLVSSGIVTINDDNEVYGYRSVNEVYTSFEEVKKSYNIVHPSILARKEWYLRNNYDTNYPRSEDYELWCRAISNKDLKLAVLPDLLYYYREEGNLSANKLIRTYVDSFKIYCNYTNSYDFRENLKTKAKINTIRLLDSIGLLQTLANKRNKKEISKELKEYHQSIIDNL